jgi:hypothetical protein
MSPAQRDVLTLLELGPIPSPRRGPKGGVTPIYRRVQYILEAVSATFAGQACLTDSAAVYLGLPAGRYDPWKAGRR